VVHDLDLVTGVHEETAEISFQLTIPNFGLPSDYRLDIFVSSEVQNFSAAIRQGVDWLDAVNGEKRLPTPAAAYEPVYSTWYAFHQNVSAAGIDAQLSAAKKLGLSTIITDDGWQTSDNHRKYAYTGDWEPNASKFPDIAKHVNQVHAQGFKYMMWYSVPYIGKHSHLWDRFKGRLLYYDSDQEAGVLDPRFPEVREYLCETFLKAYHQWHLDGFKLDFLETFRQLTPAVLPGMDIANVQVAVVALLEKLWAALNEGDDTPLIEFRQDYIGTVMQRYANMFRVKDCPNNALKNRLGILTMRLLCPDAAIHSDMLMWHQEEYPEQVALQLINCIFGVPQISVDLAKISKKQHDVLQFWLRYMRENRTLLMHGELTPYSPQHLYPVVNCSLENRQLIVQYADDQLLKISRDHDMIDVINGTLTKGVVLDIPQDYGRSMISIYDCSGMLVETKPLVTVNPISRLNVPPAGLLRIQRT
jgi:alpha-galactosidase